MAQKEMRLDAHTLENLCLAVILLRDSEGKQLQLDPKDVLQPWVYEQIPGAVIPPVKDEQPL